jgi:hypothetical protein
MAAVPDDAIQIDVFSSNPATGDFSRGLFYTKAEAPEHMSKDAQAGAALTAPSVTPLPPLAPYAIEHILQDAAPRSVDDIHKESLLGSE